MFRGEATTTYSLIQRVDLLDWAMIQPTSLPPGDRIAHGTLRAYGTSRPIAVDLSKLDDRLQDSYGLLQALQRWEEGRE